MPAGGYEDYGRVMQALPGTARQIAKRTGMQDSGVRRLVRAFWALGLAHPGGRKPATARQPAEAIWRRGDGPKADGVRVGKPMRPLVQHIAFKHLWRALEDGATKAELRELTGLTVLTILRALRAMQVHICEYETDALGRPVAVWKLGKKPDVPRPLPPSDVEKWRRYQQRKAWRVLAQQGVTA
jgi:hypothetical protein